MKRPDLPVYYYHDHFVEMLSFVRTTYGPILTDEHDAFVLRFQSLSKDAQCLLIRMVNRRGAIFNRTLFRYAEISDVERAADDLLACGQARTLKAEDYAAFVACLPKDILVAGAKAAGRTDIRVSWPKAKLADYFLTHVPFRGRRRALRGGEVHRVGRRPAARIPALPVLRQDGGGSEELRPARSGHHADQQGNFVQGPLHGRGRGEGMLPLQPAARPHRSQVDRHLPRRNRRHLRRSELPERLRRRSAEPRRLSSRSVLREARREGSRQATLSRRFVAGMQ